MDGLELHGERSEAPVAGQTESWMLFKNLPVEMDTNICSHVLRTNLQHLEENTGREESCFFFVLLNIQVFGIRSKGWTLLDSNNNCL